MDVQGEEQEQESMILNPSQNSISFVNFQLDQQLLQLSYVTTVTFGPALPPDLYWKRMMQFVVPEYMKTDVCRSLSVTPFSSLLLSDIWGGQFADRPVQLEGMGSSDISFDFETVHATHRPVARSLSFDLSDHGDNHQVQPPLFSEMPVTAQKKRGRPRKVQPATRRFTESALKADGYRPKPIIEKAKPKSKPRAKLLLQLVENNEENIAATPLKEKMHEKEKVSTPATPIVVMQRVGRDWDFPR
jgi:hypothetical protein